MKIALFAALAVLGGCATNDIAAPSIYSSEDVRAAKTLGDLASLRCVRGQYADEQSTQLRGQMPVSGAQVRRLYRGPDTWIKGEVVSNGAWDNVYFHGRTQAIICGERLWQSYANSSEIRFTEVGTQAKRLP